MGRIVGRGEVGGEGGEGGHGVWGWGPVANFLCYGGGQLGDSWVLRILKTAAAAATPETAYQRREF